MRTITIEVPENASPTINRAVDWLADLARTLIRKNESYGDSAANPVRIFSKASPVEQVLVRIDDKLSRIMRGAGLLAADEDTVRDLAGYLAIYAAMRMLEGAARMAAQPGAIGCS